MIPGLAVRCRLSQRQYIEARHQRPAFGQRRAIELETMTPEDLRLQVERRVVAFSASSRLLDLKSEAPRCKRRNISAATFSLDRQGDKVI